MKEKKTRPTALCLLTTGRMPINDHITLDWCCECASSDVNVVGLFEHILSNTRSSERGFLLSLRWKVWKSDRFALRSNHMKMAVMRDWLTKTRDLTTTRVLKFELEQGYKEEDRRIVLSPKHHRSSSHPSTSG